MLRQIREHDLQHFLVDYLIGPALHCDFIGRRGADDVFKLETTTGFYELHLAESAPESAVARLDGSKQARLEGRTAFILPCCPHSYFYFYKEAA